MTLQRRYRDVAIALISAGTGAALAWLVFNAPDETADDSAGAAAAYERRAAAEPTSAANSWTGAAATR